MDTIHVTADVDALRIRAAELVDAGRIAAARPLLAAAMALSPSAELTVISARIAMANGTWDDALRELNNGIAADPCHAGLRKCRAEVHHRLGDAQAAARDAAEAVILDPRDPMAKAALGAALLDLGLIGDAVACLGEAVSAAPRNIGYRGTLASALERAGDPEAALVVLTDGIDLCPTSVSIHNAAVILCLRRRDFSQAVRMTESTRFLGIADACTFGLKGHALSSLGQHDEAAAAYQDALKLDPEDPHVRHLVASSGAILRSKGAPEGYIRTIFDSYADRFEMHLISLGYSIPAAMRSILLEHPKLVAGVPIGPVLDLGCGTGMVALAIGDLSVGPFTGVDLSPKMLAHARAKRLYTELREADIVADLAGSTERWPLITAADVLSYSGALEELLGLVHQRLEPNGWFVFSVEALLPDHDGTVPGNGSWALQRQGRYVHGQDYVYETVCAAGFRVVCMNHTVIRQEAGADVPGLLFAVERTRHDG